MHLGDASLPLTAQQKKIWCIATYHILWATPKPSHNKPSHPHVPSWAIFLSEGFRGSVRAIPGQGSATLVLKRRMGVRGSSHGPRLGGQIPPKFNLTSDRPALVWPALGEVELSGPLRLRVQSQSRTRLRIAASIAFLFRVCFKRGLRDYRTTIARLSPLLVSGLGWGGWELLPVRGCEIGRDRASQSHSLSQRGSYSCRGGEAERVQHSTGWGGH